MEHFDSSLMLRRDSADRRLRPGAARLLPPGTFSLAAGGALAAHRRGTGFTADNYASVPVFFTDYPKL
jgi:hypothetical protein